MPLWLCVWHLIAHYTTVIMLEAGQREWSLLSGHGWYVAKSELVFPSRE